MIKVSNLMFILFNLRDVYILHNKESNFCKSKIIFENKIWSPKTLQYTQMSNKLKIGKSKYELKPQDNFQINLNDV